MGERDSIADAELVRRSLQGDTDAFGALVDRYARAAYAVAMSVTGRHEDAEDAAQESFLVALQRLEECRKPDRFGAWLMTIVRNRSRNLVRREVLRDTDPIPAAAGSKGPTPEKDTEQSELRAQLEGALAQLPEVQREIVLLHDLEGFPHREIAELLGISIGTSKSQLSRARGRMRQLLGDDYART